jgi:hypothetical protein
VGEVDGPGIDAEHAAGGRFRRHPAAPAVITYPGRRSPDVHISLITGGGQGSVSAVVEVGGSAHERLG